VFLLPARKTLAAAQFEAVKLRVGNAVINLCAELKSACYALQADLQIQEHRRTVARAAEIATEFAKRQHDAGNISDLDLATQQAAAQQAKLDLTRSDTAIAADREKLTRLMGLWGNETQWTIAGALTDLPAEEPPLDHLESPAIAQRLDVAAARAETQLLASAIPLARNSLFGHIAVGVDTERGTDGANVTGPTVEFELSIFDQRQAATARVQAQLRQGQQRLAELAIDVRSEVREARHLLFIRRQMVEYYRDEVVPAREKIVAFGQSRLTAE